MPTKHKRKKQSRSFLKKVFLSLLLLTVIITLLLTAFLTMNYLNAAIATMNHQSEQLIQQSNYSIAYLDETARRLSNALLVDNAIITYLNMSTWDARAALMASLVISKQEISVNGIDSIYLYNEKLDLYYSSRTGEQRTGDLFSDQTLVKYLSSPDAYRHSSAVVLSPDAGGTTNVCTYVAYDAKPRAGEKSNAVVINLQTRLLTESIQSLSAQGSEGAFWVLDENGVALSADTQKGLPLRLHEIRAVFPALQALGESGNQIFTLGNARYMVTFSCKNANGWYLLCITPLSVAYRDIAATSMIAALIVAIMLALCILVCYIVARRLNQPMQAMKRALSGDTADLALVEGTDDFREILLVFSELQAQNNKLDELRQKHKHDERQTLLVALMSDSVSQSDMEEKLERLELMPLANQMLYMCLLKMDHYAAFVKHTSHKERWALRFAVEDVLQRGICKEKQGYAFSYGPDEFVLLLPGLPMKAMQSELEGSMARVQQEIKTCLDLSLSIAYSTPFTGFEHLPSMYQVLGSAIQLRLRYGHGCIISPHMLDEMDIGDVRIPLRQEARIIERTVAGEHAAAMKLFRDGSERLYRFTYNEIIACVLHLAYGIYATALERNPAFNDQLNFPMKNFMRELEQVEVAQDVDGLMDRFISEVCQRVSQNKISGVSSNSTLIVFSIEEIVKRQYADPDLCLTSIAEALHLSPNYIGHIFKTAKGQSISQYIMAFRMDMLAHMLKTTSQPLSAILKKVGFEKNNYFYTRFKKHFGISLGEYRIRLSQAPESKSEE